MGLTPKYITQNVKGNPTLINRDFKPTSQTASEITFQASVFIGGVLLGYFANKLMSKK